VVLLPGTHFLVVRFEQANVKKFQLHNNMGKEAERYVRGCCVSLSISSFLSQPSNQMLGLYLGDIPHIQVVQFDHKASCWGKFAVTFCILRFGIPKHFHISFNSQDIFVKVVSYQYRSPSVSCARLKRFWSRQRQFRQGFPCLP